MEFPYNITDITLKRIVRVLKEVFETEERKCLHKIIIYLIIYLFKGGNGWDFGHFGQSHFFILLNKFNLHTIIYNSLKFQSPITVVRSFIRPYVHLCAI